MTTETTTREPVTVTVDGQAWVFKPTGHPSDYYCGDLRLRDHKRTGGGWSMAPTYGTALHAVGLTGHDFTEPTPEAAMRAFLAKAAQFCQRREAENEVLRKHGLLPPAPKVTT